jgi:hypothetical protein
MRGIRADNQRFVAELGCAGCSCRGDGSLAHAALNCKEYDSHLFIFQSMSNLNFTNLFASNRRLCKPYIVQQYRVKWNGLSLAGL